MSTESVPEAVPDQPFGLPEWIEPTFRFTPGVDPIGLRALTAGRIVARLTPGVLALSNRARYVSFYAWLLKRYAEQHRALSMTALGHYILTREYEFGLAVRLCPNGCGASPMGMRRIGPVVAGRPEAYERGESLESPQGGYGLYYRSPMLSLELVRPPGTMLGDEAISLEALVRQAGQESLACVRQAPDRPKLVFAVEEVRQSPEQALEPSFSTSCTRGSFTWLTHRYVARSRRWESHENGIAFEIGVAQGRRTLRRASPPG